MHFKDCYIILIRKYIMITIISKNLLKANIIKNSFNFTHFLDKKNFIKGKE